MLLLCSSPKFSQYDVFKLASLKHENKTRHAKRNLTATAQLGTRAGFMTVIFAQCFSTCFTGLGFHILDSGRLKPAAKTQANYALLKQKTVVIINIVGVQHLTSVDRRL